MNDALLVQVYLRPGKDDDLIAFVKAYKGKRSDMLREALHALIRSQSQQRETMDVESLRAALADDYRQVLREELRILAASGGLMVAGGDDAEEQLGELIDDLMSQFD